MRSQSSKPLIAWDLDNTLFDRDGAFLRCLQSLADVHAADDRKLDTESWRRIMNFDQSGRADRLATMAVVAEEFGLPVSRAETLWAAVQNALPRHVEPDPVARRLLHELAQTHRLALISNGAAALQRGKLERTEVAQFFEPSLILISGELGCAKPDRAIFHELARRSGLSLEATLFVGDDPVNDIAGAAASQMRTCWISRGLPTPAGLAPDYVVRDLHELCKLCGKASLS